MRPVLRRSVYLTLLLALLLFMMPWSGWVLKLRPDVVLLTLIYWIIRSPRLCNVGTAWIVGLMMDMITGGILGQYGMAYAITSYFAVAYQRRLALFNIVQQAAYVFLLQLLCLVVMWILRVFESHGVPDYTYFLPAVSGTVLWFIVVLWVVDMDMRRQTQT